MKAVKSFSASRVPSRRGKSERTLFLLFLFFNNYPEEIFDASAVEDFSSDHLAVSYSMLTKLKRLKKSGRTVYNLKKADLSGLESALRNLSWDLCLWTMTLTPVLPAGMTCFYLVPKVVIKDVNRPPWIEREVLLLIRKKDRTRRKAKLNDSVNLMERFRKIFF